MKVVGVDGCRGGWIAMIWDVDAGTIVPRFHATLAELISAHADASAIAIDIPIGLSDTGTRRCDIEARKLLGPGRASSVFPPPIPAILNAPTFAEATRRSVELIGKGISQQAFALFPKIAEASLVVTPETQDRVFEIHPEVSFFALAGHPMVHRKVQPDGYNERRDLLMPGIGIELPDRNAAFGWARPARPDDLLDATVAAWTAHRVAVGTAGRLPAASEFAPSGHFMEMVF